MMILKKETVNQYTRTTTKKKHKKFVDEIKKHNREVAEVIKELYGL